MKSSSEIRLDFLEFFRSKEHHIVPSAPMVVKNDPTLMFTNAGMNQFKDIFLDNKVVVYPKIANTQKCLRVSGKHNDLEEVGHDIYHHTMFEMLGNWSFGDYFKKEAIEWAFELLTKIYGISPDIIYATYFEGDTSEHLEADIEAKELWKNFLPADRVLPGNKKDNFWEMGESGPCGPCSEIHVDMRTESEKKQIPGYALVNANHPQVVEIWNLVFIQFNRDMHGKLHPLKSKHVDTGMGFERLCRVIQGKTSNYDTDLFTPLLIKLEEISGLKYGKDEKIDIAFRVVADHLRAISFSIADGQIPSNVKAGYVIRRILRRAVRYGFTFLNMNNPFVCKLVPTLVKLMGEFFPELEQQQSLIYKVIHEEELSFLKTLEIGIQKFEDYVSQLKNNTTLSGKFVFELYDTYGFPLDLTELMCREKGLTVDMDSFNACLNEQKDRSRKDAVVEKEDWTVLKENKTSDFIGWDYTTFEVQITRYRKINKKGKDFFHLVFDKTPFYGESGGQTGDRGRIFNDNEHIAITDTIKEFDLTIHITEHLPQQPEALFMAEVDTEKRIATMRNHTATHLMHYALREILGNHVEQKGSLVTPDYLRFDFSHFQKMPNQDIEKVEHLVNVAIMNNYSLNEQRNISYDAAIANGAIALFGERYDNTVRTIRFADSIELCGGTHVQATGSIGVFKILSESAIAAGIRRIEAVTGNHALRIISEQSNTLQRIKAEFNNSKNIVEVISNLKEQVKKLEKKIEDLELAEIGKLASDILKEATQVSNILYVEKSFKIPSLHIKHLTFELRNRAKAPYFIVLGNEAEGKASISVVLSDDIIKEKGLHAGKIVKELAPLIGGGGGGQAEIATAGGTNPAGIDSALKKAAMILNFK